jgi:virulence factor
MSAVNPLRIGVIGSGYIAHRAFFPLLANWPEVEIAGVFSRDQAKLLAAINGWPGLKPVAEISSLLTSSIHAAFVLTPAETHFQICQQLLEAGIHVFVEKPATTSAADTLRLAQTAAEKDRVFMVGFNRRFAPLVQKARAQVDMETVRLCVVEKHRPGLQARSLAEAYQEDLIHQVDLLRFLNGELIPEHTAFSMKGKTLLSAVSSARTRHGGMGVLLASRESGMWHERVSLYGAEKTIELDMFKQLSVREAHTENVYCNDHGGSWTSHLEVRGFKGEIQHFFDCIWGRTPCLSDGFEAAESQKLQEGLVRISEN